MLPARRIRRLTLNGARFEVSTRGYIRRLLCSRKSLSIQGDWTSISDGSVQFTITEVHGQRRIFPWERGLADSA